MSNDQKDRLNYLQHQGHQVLAALSQNDPQEDIEILEMAIRLRLRDLEDQQHEPIPHALHVVACEVSG